MKTSHTSMKRWVLAGILLGLDQATYHGERHAAKSGTGAGPLADSENVPISGFGSALSGATRNAKTENRTGQRALGSRNPRNPPKTPVTDHPIRGQVCGVSWTFVDLSPGFGVSQRLFKVRFGRRYGRGFPSAPGRRARRRCRGWSCGPSARRARVAPGRRASSLGRARRV